MTPILAAVVIGGSFTACLHFLGRIFRNRADGRTRAAAVSVALSLLAVAPLIVVGLTTGTIGPRWFPALNVGAVVLSVWLVVAILRVEVQDTQRRAVKKSREEAAQAINDWRAGVGRPPTEPGAKPPQ